MARFKEFKIVDILDWQSQKEIDPLNIRKLSIKSDMKYPFYGQATVNNGIISYLSLTEDVLNNKEGKPTILVHSNNQNIVYLETPFYLKDGHGATSVLQADYLNEKISIYIISSIKHVITKIFTYNKKATKIALKNTTITLPVKSDDELDLDYMEKCVDDIIKETTSLIKNHLKSEGLDKGGFTDVENKDIEKLRNNQINYAEFKLGDLFDVHPTKSYGYTNSKLYATKGNVPVVSNSSENNGIGGYVGLEPTEKGGIITFSDTTLGAETVFYQPIDFIGYSHVQGLYPYTPSLWTENSLLYFMSVFKKSAGNQFDYSIKFNREIVSKLTVKLPVLLSGEIDFKFMENYINYLKKIEIKKII